MKIRGGILGAVAIVSIAGVVGCEGASDVARAERASAVACTQVAVPWGSAEGELGRTARGDEIAARGPEAVAVGPRGQVLVLDSVNRRLVELKGDRAVTIATVDVDADDLAIGPDGAIAVSSSTRRVVRVHGPDGAPAGEVAIPTTVRSINGVSLGASRQVAVRTALQETMPLGSPAAPRALASAQAGTRDGAFVRADGAGLSVRVDKRAAALLLSQPDERGADSIALPGVVDGANLVGLAGDIACARLERIEQPAGAINVTRRALCVDTRVGKVVLDRALPAPAMTKPRAELAVGGSPVTLASLQPRDDAMVVEICEVAR